MDMWQPDMIHPPRKEGEPLKGWQILSWTEPEPYKQGRGVDWKIVDNNGPVTDGLYMEIDREADMVGVSDDPSDKMMTIWLYGDPVDTYYSQRDLDKVAEDLKNYHPFVHVPDKLAKQAQEYAKILFTMTKF